MLVCAYNVSTLQHIMNLERAEIPHQHEGNLSSDREHLLALGANGHVVHLDACQLA